VQWYVGGYNMVACPRLKEKFGKDIFTECWNEAQKEHQKRMEKMFPNRGD
jgi:hypothetical protein